MLTTKKNASRRYRQDAYYKVEQRCLYNRLIGSLQIIEQYCIATRSAGNSF